MLWPPRRQPTSRGGTRRRVRAGGLARRRAGRRERRRGDRDDGGEGDVAAARLGGQYASGSGQGEEGELGVAFGGLAGGLGQVPAVSRWCRRARCALTWPR